MSLGFKVSVIGLRQIRKSMEDAALAYRQALAAALYQEGLEILAESKKECPVDEQFLRGSGYVAPPSPRDAEPTVEIGYGMSYGPYVHEIEGREHTVGKSHFLRDPINRAKAGYTRRIQRKTRSNKQRGLKIGGVGASQPKRPSEKRKG